MATGEIGATIELPSDSPSGYVTSASSSVGFWRYSGENATLLVTAQAFVTGYAAAISGSAFAKLEVGVLAATSQTQTARSVRPTAYNSSIERHDRSGVPAVCRNRRRCGQ